VYLSRALGCRVTASLGLLYTALQAVTTLIVDHRVTTCLENLDMSWNLTAVREMSGILLKVGEMLGKISWQGKVA